MTRSFHGQHVGGVGGNGKGPELLPNGIKALMVNLIEIQHTVAH